MTSPSRAVLVLANPASGGGLAGELVPHLVRELGRRGLPAEVFSSTAAGQIRERAAAGLSAPAWVVVGGDGTLREALGALPPPDLPIAVLPAGTANVLAASLGLPKDPRATAELVRAGRSLQIDMGLARSDGGTEEPFVLCVGAGYDASIIAEVHRRRGGGTWGKLRYVGPLIEGLVDYEAHAHRLVLEDGEVFGPFEELVVANVRNFGGIWKLPETVRCDDGLLDCLGFRAPGAGRILRLAFLGSIGRLREGRDFERRQAVSVRLESNSTAPVQIDGDPGPPPPLDIRLMRGRLRILAPAR